MADCPDRRADRNVGERLRRAEHDGRGSRQAQVRTRPAPVHGVPDAELDREIETALHSSKFLAAALVPALGVTALLMAALALGAWSRDAEASIPQRQAILLGGLVVIGFSIPAFANWSLGKLLTRSLDRTFSRRMAS